MDNAFQYSPGAQSCAGCGVWQVLVIGSQNCPPTQFSGSAEALPALNSDKAVMGATATMAMLLRRNRFDMGLILPARIKELWSTQREEFGERVNTALVEGAGHKPFPEQPATAAEAILYWAQRFDQVVASTHALRQAGSEKD